MGPPPAAVGKGCSTKNTGTFHCCQRSNNNNNGGFNGILKFDSINLEMYLNQFSRDRRAMQSIPLQSSRTMR